MRRIGERGREKEKGEGDRRGKELGRKRGGEERKKRDFNTFSIKDKDCVIISEVSIVDDS